MPQSSHWSAESYSFFRPVNITFTPFARFTLQPTSFVRAAAARERSIIYFISTFPQHGTLMLWSRFAHRWRFSILLAGIAR